MRETKVARNIAASYTGNPNAATRDVALDLEIGKNYP